MTRRITRWFIQEAEVLRFVEEQGYLWLPSGSPGWFDTDYPISFNGSDGKLHSYGTRLSMLSREEIREQEVADFDRRRQP